MGSFRFSTMKDGDARPSSRPRNSDLRLPIELWIKAFRDIRDPADLAAVAVICRDLRPEAESALYRSPYLYTPSRLKQFCDTVETCSRRASSVRSLHVRVANPPACFSALRNLHSMQDLILDVAVGIGWFPPELSAAHLPALRTLRTCMSFDPPLFDFLASNPDIEGLTIASCWASNRIGGVPASRAPVLLPRLRAFAGPYGLLRTLDCPQLTHLDLWDYPVSGLAVLADRFASTLVNLRLGAPSFMGMNEPVWSLGDVAARLPRLRCLALRALGEDVDSFSFEYHGLDWSTTGSCSGPDGPPSETLTLVWTTSQLPPPTRDEMSLYQSSLARTAQALLNRWRPYLTEFIYWHDGNYSDTNISFTMDTDGSLLSKQDQSTSIPHGPWKIWRA